MQEDKLLRNVLTVLQFLIGLGAVPAGALFVLYPNSSVMMPLELLQSSPFSSYLIPGLYLLAINGIGSLVGSYLSLRRHPLFAPVAMGLGALLMGWIGGQVYWLGYLSWMQPLYFILGAVELGLGLRFWLREQKGKVVLA